MDFFDTPEPRYISPYTDFGFKLLFGTEVNKDLLIGFLNALLNLDSPIEDLSYLNPEQLGDSASDRRAVFDVYCRCSNGLYVIVEMQRAVQAFFKDRAVYYSSFPIREQGRRGPGWDFQLSAVYTVGILDFTFDSNPDYYHHEVHLVDKATGTVFYDKLTYVFLEMPKFKKEIDECETFLDKWLFVLKNMTSLLSRPKELQERVFERLFRAAELAKMTREERFSYEESLKHYRDWKNTLDTAQNLGYADGVMKGHADGMAEGRAEGRAEGMAQGRAEGMVQGRAEGMVQGRAEGMAQGRAEGMAEATLENARALKQSGVDESLIASALNLPIETVRDL